MVITGSNLFDGKFKLAARIDEEIQKLVVHIHGP